MAGPVAVTGRYVAADDTPAAGSVLLTPLILAGNMQPDKRLVTSNTVATALAADGSLAVEVLASNDPDWNVPDGVLYEVAEYIDGTHVHRYAVFIPGPGPVDLFDLQPVDDPQSVAPFPVPGPAGPEGPRGPEGPTGPSGMPVPPEPAAYEYSASGVQHSGQTVILQGYFAVHETDTAGVDHDWGTVLHAGDKVTWDGGVYTVASINTGDATLPQVVIDNFVRSGICMVKTVEPVPAAPANGAEVAFGVSWDGTVLGMSGGAWVPVPYETRLAALEARVAALEGTP
jgi:hypothetical protein